MTTKKIHAKDVLPLLAKAVEDRGADWVYPDTDNCKYAYVPEEYKYLDKDDYPGEAAMVEHFGDTFGPACMVGYVFNALDPEFLTSITSKYENGQSVDGLCLQRGWRVGDTDYVFTSKAISVLVAAQSTQDVGGCWGDALKNAENAARLFDEAVES